MYQSDFVSLEREDWSEWFTLDFVHGPDPTALPLPLPVPLLILGIAEEPLRRLVEKLPQYRILDGCKKLLQDYEIETDFRLDISKPWGFRGVLNPYHRPGHAGIIEYCIPIPRIEKDAGECQNCGGTAEDDDMECLHCMGTGRETVRDWDILDCISATLCILGTVLELPDKKLLTGIDTKRKQLLSVSTNFERGRAFIGATLSRPFGSYLRLLSNQRLPEVREAIQSAYLQMFPGYARFDDCNFRADVRNNGQLIIDVPGDACGLYVDGFSRSLKEASGPMKLSCHNVDGHHQQLTLLSGLAALSGIARKSLYPDE